MEQNNLEKKTITIGTRKSELALWQAYFIQKEIENKYKSVKVEIKKISTKGDKILDVALSKIGDKGLFTKEIENELLAGTIDIAVHSLKDLPTVLPKGLELAAVTKRHASEDVLVARKKGVTLESLPEGATVATGSLRRASQILHMRPDITIVDIRGNVQTRLKKFAESKWDGMILARAGLERLKLKKHISSIIPSSHILPAVGQGALAIEISSKNAFARDIAEGLHNLDTFYTISAERAFLKALGGGCQVPIGAHAEIKSNGLYLSGFVGSPDGKITFTKTARGSKANAEALGKALAKDISKAGGKKVLLEVYK
ncbi:MAG: hydroxymethylbilane synthase [Bacteroidetes bacterium]|nr:hydroxymethylbilane synthase [Bacteroidota bacterium]MBU1115909.1 hydroxymethylbilane synthase [Bacteroidota bacterium]MBU1798732.1 hydroxymethylbilane synthase [Bacteroidota bacterium]